MRKRTEFKVFLRGPGIERYYLNLLRAIKNREYALELGEYLVHARLDLVTKLQKYTTVAYS